MCRLFFSRFTFAAPRRRPHIFLPISAYFSGRGEKNEGMRRYAFLGWDQSWVSPAWLWGGPVQMPDATQHLSFVRPRPNVRL